MAKSIASLYVDLKARSDGLAKDLNRIGKKLGPQMRAMGKAAGVAMAAGVAAGAAGLTVMTKKGLETGDALAKAADRAGITTERLQAMHHAAELNGGSVSGMNKALLVMNKNLGDASQGVGEAKRYLDDMGLSAEELVNLGTEEAFDRISDSIAKYGTAAERTAAAQAIFGRGGQELLIMLAKGSEEINNAQAQLERLGVSLNRIDAAKIEAANDSFSRLGLITTGINQRLAAEMAPYLEAIATKILHAAENAGGFGNVFQGVIDGILWGAGLVADAIRGWDIVLQGGEVAILAFYGAVVGVLDDIQQIWHTVGERIKQSWAKLFADLEVIIAKANAQFQKLNPFGSDEDYQRAMNNLSASMAKQQEAREALSKPVERTDNGLAQAADTATQAWRESMDELNELLAKPLPSDEIKKWSLEVQIQADDAAQAVAEASEKMQGITGEADTIVAEEMTETTEAVDQVDKVLAKSERNWGKWAEAGLDSLGDLLNGDWGSLAKSIGSLFGGQGGGNFDWGGAIMNFGGMFAKGGTLEPGKWGIAGENGPELIRGGTSGMQIAPVSQGSFGGGQSVTIHQHINYEAGVTPQQLDNNNRTLMREVPRMLVDHMQRGGAFRRGMS